MKKNIKKEETINNCEHSISLEEISCFWGGSTISNKCIFCNKEIDKNDNNTKITFQTYYDEFGDPISPHYSLSEIYNIIKTIIEKNKNNEIDLIKEIETLNLENVLIKNINEEKIRKRQE